MNAWLEDYLNEHVPTAAADLGAGLSLTVQKMTSYVQVPNEILADMGLIPWVWNKSYEPTRRERFRWWRSGLRDRFAVWAYERISGTTMPGDPDY